ncbi:MULTISPECIES: FAD-dependent oxidoreductase [unclassified Rhizobium]|jgi:3-phenylpropionate/trans-cinnamate dioxygenase ferredoxin reductase subunit|uniref:NAD(P)/FAD-dependent oxidoreductase n=1 Tax=unclassified Rhizobium TaxID=2613769 RepID=UPI0006463AA4|nr:MULTISPECIES: FAD-dependent oxidoreductase [unclassified Rhizobium]MBN8952958.1 FAD-dependent oxidoreductase [Rhizobium tropici]OJY76529.1 MAG: ferredoxin reductase [Rhizobium sp. 60-20]RKD52683.1 3-phenylpropionate/trans-cinnamate dioxygenase ferredoxin reductase subunit [Rhizobium sp. WW_1]
MSGNAGVIIVGAGECGARAALSLRENGYRHAITLIGDEVHLPYERPPLSKQILLDVTEPKLPAVLSDSVLAKYAIQHICGASADAIDASGKQLMLSDGRAMPYDKLLLTTGATPRRLPNAPASSRILYLRTIEDAFALRSLIRADMHVGVLGGGFIGLEVAASARSRGAKVTVIEFQERILKRGVPEPIAEAITALHQRNGVTVKCGVTVLGIEANEWRVDISLSDGDEMSADVLVVGIGAQPRTELAAQAGIAIDNGIAVNECLETSVTDIYAAGDCCSFPHPLYGGRRLRLEAWRNAQDQGILAAANLSGAAQSYQAVPYFWSDQFDHTLQIAGLVDEGCLVVRRDLGDGAFILFHLDDDRRLVAASGVGPGNKIAKDIKLSELLIARRVTPPIEALTDANLKSLLPRAA